MSFFQNTCKPKGFGGNVMVNMMNVGHSSLANWGFTHIRIQDNAISLDVGCGGGSNIRKMLKKSLKGKVIGIDYSEISVKKSIKINKSAIERNRCKIFQGNVLELPFENETFNLATAFETIYFWADIDQSFRQIYRVLKKDGIFMICNESSGENDKDKKWTEIIKGMKIYTSEQIKYALKKAGFVQIKTDKNDKGWICLVAQK